MGVGGGVGGGWGLANIHPRVPLECAVAAPDFILHGIS